MSLFNIKIHGLTAADVAGALTLLEVAETLRDWLSRQVLARGFAKYGLPELDCRWLDSCRVACKTWHSPGGHGLKTICVLIGHEFKHHDALEDAKAAGALILAAGRKTGLTPAAWLNSNAPVCGQTKNDA